MTPSRAVTTLLGEDGTITVAVAAPTGLRYSTTLPVGKAPDRHRTILIGDSTIYGLFLQPDATIGRFLEDQLRARYGSRHEVFTLAAPAIPASTSGELVEVALAHLQPDTVVVYAGHNEMLQWRTDRELRRTARPVAAWFERRAHSWRTATLLLRTLAPATPTVERQAERVLASSRTSRVRPRIHARFRRDLADIGRRCRESGVELLLPTPVSNGREHGPFVSAFSRALTPDQRRQYERLLDDAQAALRRGDATAAAVVIQRAAIIDPEVAALVDLQGQAAWLTGDEERARRLDRRAWDLDEHSRAASERIHSILREEAGRCGAALIDLTVELERALRPDEPSLFIDYAHPTVYGQYHFARALSVVHSCRHCEPRDDVATSRELDFASACERLAIPARLLQTCERFGAVAALRAAMTSEAPEPHLAQARRLLAEVDFDTDDAPTLVAADLILALFDRDLPRVQLRSRRLSETAPAVLRIALENASLVPSLVAHIEAAGLASDPRCAATGPDDQRTLQPEQPFLPASR